MYTSSYEITKNLKIEILHKKIYLNGYSASDLLFKLRSLTPNKSSEEVFSLTKKFQTQLKSFSQFENKENFKILTHMATIKTGEGFNVPLTHPACRLELKNKDIITIHGTSNRFFKLTKSQIQADPIKDFIKSGATNPGSIITIKPVITLRDEFKNVSIFDIESVIRNYRKEIIELSNSDIEIKNEKYLNDKDEILTEIAFNLKHNNSEESKKFIVELSQNK
jgi:hypothetical protein